MSKLTFAVVSFQMIVCPLQSCLLVLVFVKSRIWFISV